MRDLDLKTRLFRYPCSYLFYSAAVDALPEEVRNRIYTGLLDIFEGRNQSPTYGHLDMTMRREILEILKDTKPDLWPSSISENLGDSR